VGTRRCLRIDLAPVDDHEARGAQELSLGTRSDFLRLGWLGCNDRRSVLTLLLFVVLVLVIRRGETILEDLVQVGFDLVLVVVLVVVARLGIVGRLVVVVIIIIIIVVVGLLHRGDFTIVVIIEIDIGDIDIIIDVVIDVVIENVVVDVVDQVAIDLFINGFIVRHQDLGTGTFNTRRGAW